MMHQNSKAFTLAEIMIVLVILGVVAAITIPALVRNQMEAQNRTRLRKAMTVYDMAVNNMVVENNFKNTAALTNWGNGNNCVNTREYFKIVQDGKNGCIFSTAGGLWWNITDITKPIVGFNENDIEAANSSTSFQLFGHFDDSTGSLRVNDLAYEQVADFLSEEEKQLLADLYNFSNNVKKADNGIPENFGTIDFFTGLGYDFTGLTCDTNDKNQIVYCGSGQRSSTYYKIEYNDSTKEFEVIMGRSGILGGSQDGYVYSYSGEKKYAITYVSQYKIITYPDGRVETYDGNDNLIVE